MRCGDLGVFLYVSQVRNNAQNVRRCKQNFALHHCLPDVSPLLFRTTSLIVSKRMEELGAAGIEHGAMRWCR